MTDEAQGIEPGRRPPRTANLPGEMFALVVEDEGGTPLVRVAGEFDLAALGRLRTVLRALLSEEPERLTIDLEAVELVETMTAGFLAEEHEAARARGISLRLRGAAGVPRRLLELAGARLARP